MDRSFKTPDELEAAFGLPVLGVIPVAQVGSRGIFPSTRRENRNRRSLLNYAIRRTSSRLVEGIRDLRTSLDFSNSNEGEISSRQVLMVTSSVPSEGKSTTSILLALNAAKMGNNILLIECDLRKPTFKTYFGNQKTGDYFDIENPHERIDDLIWTQPETKLDVIFGGKIKMSNAADFFASQTFKTFIDKLKDKYDYIVIDAPPVLPIPDARLIAPLCDKIVYCVKSGTTVFSLVSDGMRLFKNTSRQVDGFVLTQVKNGGGYGYGGSEYYDN